ncbi:MAG TPA: tetratricopeptide repeat protein [Coriobacteriia bacterium]|nr:tetratricopeptide repeat protein [Coriobacteriia bacterium]
MLEKIKQVRPLDATIVLVAVVLLAVTAYLGYSVWSQNRATRASAPISRAVSELQAMIKKNPKSVDLRLQLAQAYSASGMGDEAVAQYQAVLKLQKTNVTALTGLGFVTAQRKDWATSENYWRKAIEILDKQQNNKATKQYETANFYLANTLLEQKKYEDAVGYFKAALRVNRTASDTHFLLAQAYKGLGANDQYKEELAYAIAFEPLMAQANYEYGVVLLAEKDEAGAAQHLRIATDAAPERKEPAEALAKLGTFSDRMATARRLEKSNPEQALTEVRVAVALKPKDVDGLMLLARLYAATGDKTAAADTYQSILDIQPDNAAAKAALDRINDDK